MQQSAIKISPVNMESRKKIGIRPGDTVRVWQKIQEKGKTRLQVFEGLVLARKHGSEAGATFTVRRVSGGIGIEKIFPLYSPMIDKIEIVKRSKVRRAKLYYIREKVAREIRRQMRKMKVVDITTGSDIEEKTKAETQTKKKEEADITSTEVATDLPADKAGVSSNGEVPSTDGETPEGTPKAETPEKEKSEKKE